VAWGLLVVRLRHSTNAGDIEQGLERRPCIEWVVSPVILLLRGLKLLIPGRALRRVPVIPETSIVELEAIAAEFAHES